MVVAWIVRRASHELGISDAWAWAGDRTASRQQTPLIWAEYRCKIKSTMRRTASTDEI